MRDKEVRVGNGAEAFKIVDVEIHPASATELWILLIAVDRMISLGFKVRTTSGCDFECRNGRKISDGRKPRHVQEKSNR